MLDHFFDKHSCFFFPSELLVERWLFFLLCLVIFLLLLSFGLILSLLLGLGLLLWDGAYS